VKPKENEDLAPAALFLLALKGKLKLLFRLFRSLFKNEWTWRLFLVLQIAGLIGIIYLILTNDDRWNLFPHQHFYTDDSDWDFLNSRYWTEYHENWFTLVFLVGPFLLTKATDWIFVAKRKNKPSGNWERN